MNVPENTLNRVGANVEYTAALNRVKLEITGIVQGVGFRPFVYRLARDCALDGITFNHAQGVTIELQGLQQSIDVFITTLTQSPPPLARIDTVNKFPLALLSHSAGFTIASSETDHNAQVAISPDKCTCQDCINELNDPTDRHYRYPFTNCTNCGPRYTLINALPYDRPNTSMASFTMCPECKKAYTDPNNRRYHAQPVSCANCGPQLVFRDHSGAPIAKELHALTMTIDKLIAGEIIAIKGIGGFHLVCDATNHHSVTTLRQRKNRPAKPLAIMCKNLEMARSLVRGDEQEWQVLQSPERPITLLTKQLNDTSLSSALAPDIDKLGVFLPYTPLHHLLLQALDFPLVATSANRSGEPIITDASDIFEFLEGVVDGVLDHDRQILNGCDDSVVQVVNGKTQVIRLARGYAPLCLTWQHSITKNTLAVGAQQKNTIAFGFGHNLILSPHIGDLFSIEAEEYFNETLETFKRLYKFSPKQIIRDRHPDYAPSKWAEDFCRKNHTTQMQIQHHHAHILSVMAVNQMIDKVLGFSFDGTGLGDDSQLWGGEAMIADIDGYNRIAHLKPFSLIGVKQAIKDPRRIMLALLFEQYDVNELTKLPIEAVNSFSVNELNNLRTLWVKGVAAKDTSSMGRLFDAVACLLGLVELTQYEGQAGMMIETLANESIAKELYQEPYEFVLPLVYEQWQTQDLWLQIVDKLIQQGQSRATKILIARGFISSLANAVADLAKRHPELPVVLCGGVFQNKNLLSQTRKLLKKNNLRYLDSKLVPINDGGIALGQLWYGIHH